MADDWLDGIIKSMDSPLPCSARLSAGTGSNARIGMFGTDQPHSVVAEAIRKASEQTSAQIASIASRGLDNPASLTLNEIRSVCASALTQTANKR